MIIVKQCLSTSGKTGQIQTAMSKRLLGFFIHWILFDLICNFGNVCLCCEYLKTWKLNWSNTSSLTPTLNFGKVLHLKNQIEVGLKAAETWMSKRNMMVCMDRTQRDGTALTVRRVVQDAGTKFETVSVESLHHLGYADLTKLGRLTAIDVDDIGRWCQRVLQLNPEFNSLSLNYCTFFSFLPLWRFTYLSRLYGGPCFFNSGMVFMVAPVLAGDGVLNGLRGEHRPGYNLLYM